jgi:hypothetical protein
MTSYVTREREIVERATMGHIAQGILGNVVLGTTTGEFLVLNLGTTTGGFLVLNLLTHPAKL